MRRTPMALYEPIDPPLGFANEQWLQAHATPEQAAAIVLDQFKRAMAQSLALLEVSLGR